MSERHRYMYALLDVCQLLHGDTSGSGDGLSDERARELEQWLAWRISDGWEPSTARRAPFDDAVRALAAAALQERRADKPLEVNETAAKPLPEAVERLRSFVERCEARGVLVPVALSFKDAKTIVNELCLSRMPPTPTPEGER